MNPLLFSTGRAGERRKRRVRLASTAALVVALAAGAGRAGGAQPGAGAGEPAPERARLRPVSEGGGFPDPVWLSLLTAVAGGVAGAAAAERVAGSARRRPAAGEPGSGALEKLVVGSVAAVALLGLNPPGDAWWALAGTAVAAGAGAQAVLLAVTHARLALAAELGREAADEGARRAALLAGEQLETLRRLAVEGGMAGGGAPAEGAAWERMLDVYAERARAEVMRVARRSGTDAVRPAAGGEAPR
jgi:hypothetical protein